MKFSRYNDCSFYINLRKGVVSAFSFSKVKYTLYMEVYDMAKSKKIDKDMGFRLKKARLDQKLTYDELSEKSGVSSRYIKEIENHGNVPSLEKLGQLIRALHISADPFFYPAALNDNLDYQRLLIYLSECTPDQITTILALVEAYLRTYKTHETE